MDKVPCGDDWIDRPGAIQSFQKSLVLWGKENFRTFPWRLTHDPYAILMAEIMLHRTQVVQVIPVYQSFLARYPDISSLARANSMDLQTALSSLGLHWRISLILKMVQQIKERFDLQIPHEKADLHSLPGVSEYIASAVRCFAWNVPEPIVDTNTVRITGRLFGLEFKDSSRRNAKFRNFLATMIERDHPRDYNYALLDLAHLICLKKQTPLCQDCPVQIFCRYGQGFIKRY